VHPLFLDKEMVTLFRNTFNVMGSSAQ
jgi:hypothetical protein